MENLEPGLSLRQAVDQYGPLPEPTQRRLAEGMAQALMTIHASGSVHGAVGPDSVLLTTDGPYFAPSKTSGISGSPPDDMFDLGTTLLYAATGAVPTWDNAAKDDRARIAELESMTSVLPESLREVIGGCLYPESSTRPTAGQLVDYLKRHEIPATPNPSPGTITRRSLLLGMAGGAVVAGGITAAVLSSSGKPTPPTPLGLAGGPKPSPPSSTPTASAPTASSSSSGDPARITLDGPNATKAWTVTGSTAPTFIAASDKAILVITNSGTTLVSTVTGKRLFPSLNSTATFAGIGGCQAVCANGIFYYLGETPDSDTMIVAVDSTTNTVKWAWTMAMVEPGSSPGTEGPGWIPDSVAVGGDTVYVCGSVVSVTSSDPSPASGYIRAFDAATGDRTWHISGTDINNVLVPPSGPYLLVTSAVPSGAGQVELIDAEKKGAHGWKKAVAHAGYYDGQGWPLTCYAAGSFVFCDGDTMFVVDAATGTEKWHYRFESVSGETVELGSVFASPDGTMIYAPVGSDLAAFATADGTLKWVSTLLRADGSGAGDVLEAGFQVTGHYADRTADTVLVTDSAKNLWAIDAKTGRARWKYNDPGQPDGGFLWTIGGDQVFIASNLTLTAISIH